MTFLGRCGRQALLFKLMSEALLRSIESILKFPALCHTGLNLTLQGCDLPQGSGEISLGFGQPLLNCLQFLSCLGQRLLRFLRSRGCSLGNGFGGRSHN